MGIIFVGATFYIKTDKKSLKWLLQQKISTLFQQFWLSKLMRFNYENQYTSGKENIVDDALSRVQGSDILCMAIPLICSDLIHFIKNSYTLDVKVRTIIQLLEQQQLIPHYIFKDGILRKKINISIGDSEDLKMKIPQWQHTTGEVGHSGRDNTLRRVKSLFTWKGLTKDVSRFVKKCTIFQASRS